MIKSVVQVTRTWGIPWILFGLALALTLSSVSATELPNLWRQGANIGALALAMTAIMLTGGIDLSVGSTVALAGVVLALLHQVAGWPIEVAMMASVATGALAGAGNGLLVAFGVPPLVATLATMALYRGMAMALAEGKPIGGLPESMEPWAWGFWLGLPFQVHLLIVVALIYYLFVHHTAWGRALYAIGENRLAAEFAALRVKRIEASLYVMSGTVAGLVAIPQVAEGLTAAPNAAAGFELQAIACVVLGGTRVTGGFGSIPRTLLGLATLVHLKLGFRLNSGRDLWIPGFADPIRLDANIQLIIIGLLVILVAVINERLVSRRRF